MSKEMFEQWASMGKNSFKPFADLNTRLQEHSKKLVMQVSGAVFEQINNNVKLLQTLPSCKKPEDFFELNNKLTKGTLEGLLNLAQDTLEMQMECFSHCTEWSAKQASSFTEAQEKAAKAA